MNYIFGPVASRRFGLSLGIDLSPEHKTCNFDCLYCELKPAKPVDTQSDAPQVEAVVDQVRVALKKFQNIEVITITSNGEPTLYPYLDELVDALNTIKKEKKLLILSNASKIDQPSIQQTLKKIDIVKLSLDCATDRCFKRLDRPYPGLKIENIIKGMEAFRKTYEGLFVVEILVVAGINDKEEEFQALNSALQRIKPDRVDIGTIDRPPAYRVNPVSYHRLFELSKYLHNLPITIVSRKKQDIAPVTLNKEEILNLLSHRPLTQEDIQTLFDEKTQMELSQLVDEKRVQKKRVGKVIFFESSLDN